MPRERSVTEVIRPTSDPYFNDAQIKMLGYSMILPKLAVVAISKYRLLMGP